jgi:hypothetical protein
MNYENEIGKAKKELINLYLKLTIENKEEVFKIILYLLILFHRQSNSKKKI